MNFLDVFIISVKDNGVILFIRISYENPDRELLAFSAKCQETLLYVNFVAISCKIFPNGSES